MALRTWTCLVMLALTTAASGRAMAQDWKQWVPKLPSSPRSQQKEGAQKLMPVAMQLGAPGGTATTSRVIRVRVWAAADYRRQTREWQSKVRRLIERVNSAAQGWVRFEVVEQRSWPRESSEGALDGLLDELAKVDAGDDVDLVVGTVAALPVFPGSVDNIGMARLFSRHMVMRSLHDLAEYDAVRRWFDTFTDAEKDAIVAARKLHKEQVVFLHEWAHTLGVIHVKRAADLMNPAYDAAQSGFDASERNLVEVALRHRAADGPRWLELTAREVRELAERAPDEDWDPRDRQLLLSIVTSSNTSTVDQKAEPGRAPAVATTPVAAAAPLSDADRATMQAALALGRAGEHDEAWARLAPVEAKNPRSFDVKLAACELAVRHPRGAESETLAVVACKAAAALSPHDARPHLQLATLYLDDGDDNRAQAPLGRAGELLDGSTDADAWRQYALALERAHQLTRATEAAAHADAATAAEVAARAQATRRRVGLRADAAVVSEPEYIRAVEAARATLGTAREAASLASLERELGAAAAQFLRCEGALGKGAAVARARAACRGVLDEAPPRATLVELRAAWSRAYGDPAR